LIRLRKGCFEEQSALRLGRFVVPIFRCKIGDKSRDRSDIYNREVGLGTMLVVAAQAAVALGAEIERVPDWVIVSSE